MNARDRVVSAVDVLNDLVGDLVTSTNVLREYYVQHRAGRLLPAEMAGVQKMCVSHLVLGCCKLIEFHKHFHDILPAEHRDQIKGLVRAFRNRGMVEFRNKIAGHIWDNDKCRPLVLSEIMRSIEKMTEGDFDAFLHWINDPKDNTYPTNVVTVVETIRDSLMRQHVVSANEAIHR